MNNQEKIWTKSFISISITQFLIFVAFYTLLTTLPIFVINDLGGTEAKGGLLITAMLLSAILVRPFSATILDRIGKKNGLIISVSIFAATMFLYIWMDAFIPLLVLRFFHGLSFGFVTTATGAIAADIIPSKRRGAGLGYFAMAMNVAVVIGPFIGLMMLQYVTFQTLFIFLSILMLVAVVSTLSIHVPPIDTQVVTPRGLQQLKLRNLVEMKALPIALISSLISLAYASIMSFIPVYADSLGLASTASYFFFVFAVVMLLSRPSLGKAFDTRGPKFVILPCLFIFSIGLVVLSFTSTSWMLLVAAGLIGLGYGSLLPSFQTMAIQAAPPSRSAHATSTFFIFYDSGIAAGSFVWGLVVAGYGFPQLYMLCAAVVLVVMLLFNLYHAKRVKSKPASNQGS
ncbi:MFS family permease [Virgibacillus natechei]|uniref:MFS family permease n=1 Tax=Virgibacillus natechei TaxID=1216297 RepID=A0ABS4IJI2_9BACI|nr:MFS transporter [Virgibacillus natechei]MBP1971117.1 MFS family permease [Virgibacillus natechei]UZD12197.1 MFS transporter [Virgibacillus natechei]